jgi:hypothetical protein
VANPLAEFRSNVGINTEQYVLAVSSRVFYFVAGFNFDPGQPITKMSVSVAGCMSENLILRCPWYKGGMLTTSQLNIAMMGVGTDEGTSPEFNLRN